MTTAPTPQAGSAALHPDAVVGPLVVRALKVMGSGRGRRALDIGAGDLSNARYLLDRSFDVDVIDLDTAVAARAAALDHPGLRAFTTDIRRYPIEPGRYHLVVALSVLSFLPPPAISQVLEAVRAGLTDEGLLCCTLLGDRASWARRGPPATAFTRAECRQLVSGWRDVRFTEIEFDGTDAFGADQHWHWCSMLLRRRGRGPTEIRAS